MPMSDMENHPLYKDYKDESSAKTWNTLILHKLVLDDTGGIRSVPVKVQNLVPIPRHAPLLYPPILGKISSSALFPKFDHSAPRLLTLRSTHMLWFPPNKVKTNDVCSIMSLTINYLVIF